MRSMDTPSQPARSFGSNRHSTANNIIAASLEQRGRIPATPGAVPPGFSWEIPARVADAAAVLGHGPGAPWDTILARLGEGRDVHIEPLPERTAAGGWAAANPLPFVRRALVRLALAISKV